MNNDKLLEAVERLVTKLQLIHVDPAYQAVWTLALTHGGYDGPNYALELEELLKALAEPASGSARSMTYEEKKCTDGFYLSHFKPAPVNDKALAEAIAQLAVIMYNSITVDVCAIDTVLAALRAAQRNNAELENRRHAEQNRAQEARGQCIAAQQEVKKLRQDNDDHAESWAMCGIPHESQLTKILVQQDEIQKLKREVADLRAKLEASQRELVVDDELREWKRQCLEVWNSWDVQAVGKLLGVPLGKSIQPAIAPGIEALQAEVAELRKDKERLDWLQRHDEISINYEPGDPDVGVFSCWRVMKRENNNTWSDLIYTDTLRAAIDKARAAGEGKGAT